MLRDHGLAAFPGLDESSNSISSTTAMGTAISRWSISSGIGFSAPIAASSLEDVLQHLLRHSEPRPTETWRYDTERISGLRRRDRRFPSRSQAAGDFNRTHPMRP